MTAGRLSFQKLDETLTQMTPDLVAFLQRLVRMPSLPGEESEAQQFYAGTLRSMGMAVDVFPVRFADMDRHPAFSDDGFSPDRRINVIGHWKGSGASMGHGSLVLNGHMDVVPVGDPSAWRDAPWSGALRDGKIYGRGACDMKAGLAAAVFAVQLLREMGFMPAHDIQVQSVIGEETGGVGTLSALLKGYTADAAIILEPTKLAVCPVQSGALTFRLHVPGRAIHAAMKKYGVSAIEKFTLLFNAIKDLEVQRHHRYRNQFFEDPQFIAPVNIGVVRGGNWPSTVPDEVVAEGRFGVFPGETVPEARRSLEETIQQAAQSDGFLKAHPPTVEWFEGQFESGQTPEDHPIIRTLANAHEAMLNEPIRLEGVTWGADLRLFTNHGKIPAVLYGPGDVSLAHTIDEYVPISQVLDAVRVIANTIVAWCGGEFE